MEFRGSSKRHPGAPHPKMLKFSRIFCIVNMKYKPCFDEIVETSRKWIPNNFLCS